MDSTTRMTLERLGRENDYLRREVENYKYLIASIVGLAELVPDDPTLRMVSERLKGACGSPMLDQVMQRR